MIKEKCDRCYEVYGWIKDDEYLYKYEDKLYCWESGEEWGFIFQFKHKGKYYLYVDCGGT